MILKELLTALMLFIMTVMIIIGVGIKQDLVEHNQVSNTTISKTDYTYI